MAATGIAKWQLAALCARRGIDPELFFKADTNFQLKIRLRRVCAACPVVTQCLEDNLSVPHGMYGGLTWRERRRLIARRTGRTELTSSERLGYFKVRLPSSELGARQKRARSIQNLADKKREATE